MTDEHEGENHDGEGQGGGGASTTTYMVATAVFLSPLIVAVGVTYGPVMVTAIAGSQVVGKIGWWIMGTEAGKAAAIAVGKEAIRQVVLPVVAGALGFKMSDAMARATTTGRSSADRR
jgi:hypothetical protein